jgi:hypothetical protein
MSLKWIFFRPKAGASSGSGQSTIVVNEQVKQVVFGDSAATREPCNLISIFGGARQGKSFLMNCLSGTTGLFTISNLSTPCTQGIDISRNMIPLKSFSEIDGGRSTGSSIRMRVGFVDAEGQGDRDVTYDAVSLQTLFPEIFPFLIFPPSPCLCLCPAFGLSNSLDFEMRVVKLDGQCPERQDFESPGNHAQGSHQCGDRGRSW